jgi:hypothetical protein
MKQSGTSALLQGAVQDLASSVVSDLDGGGHAPPADTTAGGGSGRDLELAAARVVGADLLLPGLLHRTPLTPDRLALLTETLDAFPPRPQAAPTVQWSHWAMARALRLADASAADRGDGPAEPDTAWLDGVPWPFLTHQLAVLAPLALAPLDCAVAQRARERTLDLARGFVRAIRRRDWRQAAGAGRWLAQSENVPDTLGLDTGLDFVQLMGGSDPRVLLQVRAARLTSTGVLV